MCDVTERSGGSPTTSRPQWGTLYAIVVLMLATLTAVEIAVSPGFTERALECGLVLGGFGAMAVWTRRNRAALDGQDWCVCAGAKVTMRVIGSRRPEPARVEVVREPTPAGELEEIAR
jgi:hypothetical protein